MRRVLTVVLALLIPARVRPATPEFDILISGGRVLDGAGNPWFYGDIAIRGDTIAAVGRLGGASARLRIDASGRAVSPGFIDIHSHARWGIFEHPAAENYIRQGVTTVIDGNDGDSPIPLRQFLDSLSKMPVTLNFGMFAGQGSIRESVIGGTKRPASAEETRRMRELTRQAMLDGAFGLSTGLFYVPGTYTPTEEIIALARVAGSLGGIYISHMRDEAREVVASVEETIRIGEEAGLPAQVTHHKIIGAAAWGSSRETLALIERARARGVDVTIDQYPYTASSTSLEAALFPQWAIEGGRAELARRLADPSERAKIKATVIDRIRNERGGGDPASVVLANCPADPALDGKTLAAVTAGPPTVENAAETTIGIEQRGDCTGIFHAISEEDVERILRSPLTMIASDGEIPSSTGVPHPRSYGTFARVLGVYVREKKLITIEEAIRKMTSMPAARLRLPDRGLLRPGMKADVVVFDPATVIDKATFSNPRQFAAGFDDVLVNGRPVILRGALTRERPGRVLYGPARRPVGQ
jgi:dihydroorotase/N-acyl-D-amino-acid deacylase